MTHSKEHIAKRVASRRANKWFTDPLISKKISDGLHRRFNSLSHAEQERIREKARIAGKMRMRERGHCKQCGKQLVGQQKSFCSRACRNRAHPPSQAYKKNGEWRICLTCGKTFYRPKFQLLNRTSLYCSMSCSAKPKTKERNPNWKGGVTSATQAFYQTDKHIKWARKVKQRDNYTCQDCLASDLKLHAHHIKPVFDFPELANTVSNGIALCVRCHNKRHRNTRGRKRKCQVTTAL